MSISTTRMELIKGIIMEIIASGRMCDTVVNFCFLGNNLGIVKHPILIALYMCVWLDDG